jgi:hypothetical protein
MSVVIVHIGVKPETAEPLAGKRRAGKRIDDRRYCV